MGLAPFPPPEDVAEGVDASREPEVMHHVEEQLPGAQIGTREGETAHAAVGAITDSREGTQVRLDASRVDAELSYHAVRRAHASAWRRITASMPSLSLSSTCTSSSRSVANVCPTRS